MADLTEVVKRSLQQTGEQFRNLALDRAANICDDLHVRGLDASHCAIAIRMLKDALNKENTALTAGEGTKEPAPGMRVERQEL